MRKTYLCLQLQAALLDIHEIFFDVPVWERMQFIAHDRQLREERRLRESVGLMLMKLCRSSW